MRELICLLSRDRKGTIDATAALQSRLSKQTDSQPESEQEIMNCEPLDVQ